MNTHYLATAPVSQSDFIGFAPAVCERLLGEPSSRSARELRWGRKGSFRLKLNTGTWSDFEAGEGGGVLALVMREERLDKAGALAWLEAQGFLSSLSRSPERGRSGAYGGNSGKAVAAQSPYSPAIKDSTTHGHLTLVEKMPCAGYAVPRQPFLPDASIDFAALTPSLTVDSALHRYDNL